MAFVEGASEPMGYAKLRAGLPDPSVSGPNAIELQRIYVDRSATNRGIGAHLMQACLHSAQSAGFHTVWLGVWERNPRAIAFYERWGFEPVGDHVFRLGSEDQRDVVMQRPVSRLQ
jgi:ribosomal protein S18 acetylase RimI-like enzyme